MIKRSILNAILFLIVVMIFGFGIDNASSNVKEEELARIEDNIRKAVANCYAIEGFYPASVDYLQENYGIIIDSDRYHVYYSTIGSNIYPDIAVYQKGEK